MNNHSLQNTEKEPICARFDPSRTRRTHEVPLIAGLSHFTRKNTRFPAPAFSQNEAHATSMQPLQCVLQAKIPKHHVTAMCKNRQNTSKQPLQCGLLQALAEPSPHPPHTRGTFHRRPVPLHTEKHKVSCPGFLPKQSPCNIHAARCNTFCKQRFQNTMQLQCARKGKTHRSSHYSADYSKPWPNPARTRRTHEVPCIAGRSHCTRKNPGVPTCLN